MFNIQINFKMQNFLNKPLAECTKEEIQKLFNTNQLQIIDNNNPNISSEIWRYVGFPCKVNDQESEKTEITRNFVACKTCKLVYNYDPKGTGNTNILNHTKICGHLSSSNPSITVFDRNNPIFKKKI